MSNLLVNQRRVIVWRFLGVLGIGLLLLTTLGCSVPSPTASIDEVSPIESGQISTTTNEFVPEAKAAEAKKVVAKPIELPKEAAIPLSIPATPPEPVKTSQDDLYTVIKVVDGDTIDVTLNGKTQRVRYIGVDTPETVHPTKDVQCFGKDASAKNKEFVLGKQVRLEKDVSETDRYKRLLRYVYLGDTFINLELVRQGYATAATFPPDVKHSQDFVVAEREAREGKRGLWATCKSTEAATAPKTTTPEPVATTPTPAPSETPRTSCTIKGNINADEKIYHLPGCGSYAKTKIDESQGERWFCTEQEAIQAGWRKALNC